MCSYFFLFWETTEAIRYAALLVGQTMQQQQQQQQRTAIDGCVLTAAPLPPDCVVSFTHKAALVLNTRCPP